jgi:hypothetical protein
MSNPRYQTTGEGEADAVTALTAFAESPMTPVQGMAAIAGVLLAKTQACQPAYLHGMADVFRGYAREQGWIR